MENRVNEEFWSATIDEVKKGYVVSDDYIKCLVCGKIHMVGRIFDVDGELYDARKAMELHIDSNHGSMLNYILNMNQTFTGISDAQKAVIELIMKGLSDKEIAETLGVAGSTIRNHRYKLREREKQAKLFLAMMDLLSENTDKKITSLDKSNICDAHKTATTLDDRFNITEEEKEKIVSNYFDDNMSLKTFPSKEKRKIIILEEIMKNFKSGKKYNEKEINRVLGRIYDDFASLRRALIEYGFLDRSKDCLEYWVKE